MAQLLRTEWLKLKNYPAFWWLMGISLLSYPGINGFFYFIYKMASSRTDSEGGLINLLIGNPYSFPEIFRTVAYTSSYFVFIPAILILLQISNEFTYKTNRQNIIDGWSRRQFMTAKLLGVVLVSALILFIYLVFIFLIGFFASSDIKADSFNLVYYAGLFGLQVFSQLSLAFLLGLLMRRAFIALGIFIFYMLIFENILVGIFKLKANDAGRFLLLEVSDRLTPVPEFIGRINEAGYLKSLDMINEHVFITIIYTFIFWLLAFWVYKKRDL